MKKIYKALIIALVCIIAVIGCGTGIMANSGYKSQSVLFADNTTSYNTETGVKINRLSNGNIEFVPEDIKAGFIFYPGGNVEYTAYAPLLNELADGGILCILVKMTLNLAVLDMNAADGIKDNYQEVERWYIGGHSLGGAMAGSYIEKNADDLEGLILLAAYSTADISSLGKNVISIYGTADGVMNRDRYDEYKSNLPTDLNELVIDGGCHSYFGDYGMQKGDGEPTITRDEQTKATAEYILSLV